MKPYYITTPIYYVNAAPHIGHAYTTLAADILNRFRVMRGEKTRLLTGTDEHGSKIEEVARARGVTPKAHADEISGEFRQLWKDLEVRFDDFIRTTEPRHEETVQAVFKALHEKGDIYKGSYRGFYCVSCETYWTLGELGDKRVCQNPDCGKPLREVEEESYFFKLSRFQGPLLEHYKAHPEFLQPQARAPEILRWVEGGLKDISVSRTKVAWGVQVPFDPQHTVYVWFDALLNYVSALGYKPGQPPTKEFSEYWPADVHLVGKEIFRFHAVIWPAMLMTLGLPLPRTVFAHGWWTVEGEKMSKSKGNFIDPRDIIKDYRLDAFRYVLFREMPFGADGNFSRKAFHERYNADLANNLGNLVARTCEMVDKFLAGQLPAKPPAEPPAKTREAIAASQGIYDAMEKLAFYDALTRIWQIISGLNLYIDQEKPWKTISTDPERVKLVLFDVVWSLRLVAGWLTPFMPETSAKMQAQLGVRQFPAPLTAEEVLAGGPSGARIQKAPPLFPRKPPLPGGK
ncbi:MAG: methionine--tRNA ligase [Elusimicrobia bacterium]|nr:methionine--tRNA ligase [Elusimicrobiota bacterium]